MMASVDKTKERLDLWCSAPGIKFKDALAEENYKKRARRIADVIQLKVPDRVPVVPNANLFPAFDNGLTGEEFLSDPAKAYAASMKMLLDFEPDLDSFGFGKGVSYTVLDAIGH